MILLCMYTNTAPLSQSYKNSTDVAAHCLKLPGSYLNVSILLDKKKFRSYGHKVGALRGFQLLQDDDLGRLEPCGGRGANKVRHSGALSVVFYVHAHHWCIPLDLYSYTTSENGHFLLMMIRREWHNLQRSYVSIGDYETAIKDTNVPW